MGAIQNAVNQALGTVGLAARLHPDFERNQQVAQVKKEASFLQEQSKSISLPENPADISQDRLRTIGDIEERKMRLAEKAFQLKPSKESFENLVSTKEAYRGFNEAEANLIKSLDATRQDEAMVKVANIQEAKQKQRRNFMSYLQNMQTSLGGNVGDLPANMQKAIAKQYSKSERNKLMDQMDKEALSKKDGK